MSLVAHLQELRRRLFISVITVVVGAFLCWFVHKQLFAILTLPVTRLLPEDANQLAFLSLTEPFILYLKGSKCFSRHPYARCQDKTLSGNTVNIYLSSLRAAWNRWPTGWTNWGRPCETNIHVLR